MLWTGDSRKMVQKSTLDKQGVALHLSGADTGNAYSFSLCVTCLVFSLDLSLWPNVVPKYLKVSTCSTLLLQLVRFGMVGVDSQIVHMQFFSF
jgi:hypothetical protein